MSAIPAWKRALLEKKKQQEQQEELKKKQEQEAYIKSLPAWKRAIIMRDMEKNKLASSPSSALGQGGGNAPLSPQLSSGRDKWKAALAQTSNTSPAPAAEKPAASPASSNNVPPVGSVSARAFQFKTTNSRDSTPTGKPSWARSDSPTSPKSPAVNPATPVSTTENVPSPRTLREQRRGSVQSLATQFHRPSSTSPPPPTAASPAAAGIRGKEKETTPQPKPEIKETIVQTQGGRQQPRDSQQSTPPPSQQQSSPAPAAASAQIDDSDLVGLPAWKKALIIKKRMKQAGITSLPAQQTQLATENKTPPTSAATSGRDETDSGAQLSSSNVSTSKASTSTTTGSSRPNVVNRSDDNDSGSNKLVQKEGVTLRPPIFNEVDQWANVAKDDPKFTQLPPWKQAMILRRRKDIAKRSGQETSPPESPKVKTASERRKGSTSSEGGSNQTKKPVKKSTAKTSAKVEEKKSTTKTKTNKAEEKKANVKKTKSKNDEEQIPQTTTKTAKSTGKKSGSSGGSLKPVRAAPTKPPEKKNKEVVKVQEKEKEDNEDPMFTWSFSKHSMETGDAMSASSDSELEDVHVTSIDDMLSDEDDSGIGGSGGTVLMSYKPLAVEEDVKEREKVTETTLKPRERTMSTSSSDPEIKQSMTRSESKSILVDPAKKSYRGMRRVSFSDSSLHTEHFYPKYDYSDYDEIEQELPDIFGRGKLRNINAGLSHRLHPSLRTDSEPDSNNYRYGFNSGIGGNPSSPSPSSSSTLADSPSSVGVGIGGGGGLSSYKPSMLSSFDSLGTFSSTVHTPPVLASPIKEDISAEADAESEQVDSATDYYSTLNADTAALLW